MLGLEPYWGRRVPEFGDGTEPSDNTASVISQFERMIGDLGFHGYIMAGVPTAGQSLAETTLANGWPPGWVGAYKPENLFPADPIPRHCIKMLNPFEWKDAPYDREHDPAAHNVMM